jgi:hypothetical protein
MRSRDPSIGICPRRGLFRSSHHVVAHATSHHNSSIVFPLRRLVRGLSSLHNGSFDVSIPCVSISDRVIVEICGSIYQILIVLLLLLAFFRG